VLIDFVGQASGIKSCFKFYKFRKSTYAIVRKDTPRGTVATGQVFPNSDLYALAVTALVLLTGKEPEELYDSYQGTGDGN